MAASDVTVCEKLLIAAYDLDGGDGRRFTAEDLVVAAWKRFPRAFGLRGHVDAGGVPLYPDSNRVFAEVMGAKPIRKRGYLSKVGENTYSLTETGRQVAQEIVENTVGRDNGSLSGTSGKATMPRPTRAKLERLLRSRAVQRAQANELDKVTFHDACIFWGITPGSAAIELEGSLVNVESIIATAERAVQSGASELRTGRSDLSYSTTELLRRVHGFLKERFSDDLQVIGQRTDQRRQ